MVLCINETEWHQIPEDHKLCSSFWVKSFVQCKLTTYWVCTYHFVC